MIAFSWGYYDEIMNTLLKNKTTMRPYFHFDNLLGKKRKKFL